MTRDNLQYKRRYGRNRVEPDFTRCCEEVSSDSVWSGYHQCRRKRGYGPGEAYCKQHDPAAVEKRQAAAREASRKQFEKFRMGLWSKTFHDTLEQIAGGHNDPRSLAQEVLTRYREK